jgi:mono/diheme cytochrome c family protein
LVEAGEKVYNLYCSTCHQRDGRGDGNRFPPISESKMVNGRNKALIELILRGMDGPVIIQGLAYNGVMPAHDFLSNAEVAALLTFVRKNFGNNSQSISANEVEKVRKDLSTN